MEDKIIKELKNKIGQAVILELKDNTRISVGVKIVDEFNKTLLYMDSNGMRLLEDAKKKGKEFDGIINSDLYNGKIKIELIARII